jgi:hypothetical protein
MSRFEMQRRTCGLLFALLLTLQAAGCASSPAADAPTTPTSAAAQPPAGESAATTAGETAEAEPTPEADETAMAAAGEAPDDVASEFPFVTEDGRRYRVDKLKKKEMPYRRLSETRVRTAFGFEIEVEREDEDNLYYRVYYVAADTEGLKSANAVVEGRAAEIRAALPAPLPTQDRFAASDYGRGLPNAGQWRNGFEFADMNEDGHLDLVHGPSRKGPARPQIYLGDGQGGWRHWREATYPATLFDYGDATVGDFDGDGHQDLFLGVHLHGLKALLGDGKGNFVEASHGLPWRARAADPMGFSSRQVQAMELEGDRRPEVVALGEGPRMTGGGPSNQLDESAEGLRVFRAVRDKTDRLHWEWADPASNVGDLFGEDLQVFPGRKGAFAVGSGRMDTSLLVFDGRQGQEWNRQSLKLPPQTYVWSAAPMRLADGELGLVTAGMGFEGGLKLRRVDLFRKAKGATEWTGQILWVEEKKNRGPVRVAAGDIDGDGKEDVVVSGADGQVWVFIQGKTGGFTLEQSPELQGPAGCAGYGLLVRDLDRDGKAEVAMSFAGEPNALYDPMACAQNGALKVWKLAPKPADAR